MLETSACQQKHQINSKVFSMSTRLSHVGKCIRIAQAAKDIPSRQVCESLGVPRQQLNRWRHSKNNKIHTVQRLAQVFSMSVDEFLELDRNL